jgi:hypothetical protein
MQVSWDNPFPLKTTMAEVPDSVFQATTKGGSLLFVMDLAVTADTAVGCDPLINGTWAGNPPGIGIGEGIQQSSRGSQVRYSRTRLYTGIPSGTFRFSLRCGGGSMISLTTPVSVCNGPCQWGFVELGK